MATEQTTAGMRRELRGLSDGGTSLAELLDHLGKHNQRLGNDSFSDDQEEELQLYCWALHKGQSSGALWGRAAVLGGVEDDIGA